MENQTEVLMILDGDITYDGRVQKEIKSLINNNNKVNLLTTNISSLTYIKDSRYKGLFIPLYFNKNSRLKKILSLFLFNLKGYFYVKDLKIDIIHCNDLTTLLLGYLLKTKDSKRKLIFDSHELYPETYNGNMRILLEKYQKLLLKKVDKVISPEINRLYYMKKKYNIENNKIVKIENFPLKHLFEEKENYFFKKYKYEKKGNIALYIGVIDENRGILEIIKGIEKIDELVFFCIGKFLNENYKNFILNYIEEKNLKNKIFLKESIPQIEVLSATNSADITFIFYRNTNLNNYYCASNKLYEALNCGIGIVTNNYPGIISVTANIPNVYRIEKINEQNIEKGIKYLLDKNKKEKTNFYWEDQEKTFIKIYLK